MSWLSLPAEIRAMVLESLVQDECCIAPYATICQEWQTAIEKKNFSRLELTPSRLIDFDTMLHRQKALVEYIWLRIELPEYDCPQCEDVDSEEGFQSSNDIIKRAVQELFSSLSTWEPRKSLVLDISVRSPSDSKHYFKYLHFGSNAIPDCDMQEAANAHDPPHGWINGERVSHPPWSAIYRIFEDIKMPREFWKELPEVVAVTGLLLRRQTRRRWEPEIVAHLIYALPRLQEIYYEPWIEWGDSNRLRTDWSNLHFIESLIPNELKRIVLFEDFDDRYVYEFQARFNLLFGDDPARKARQTITRALAEASLDLEHLSASFVADASHFFKAREECWVWNNLVSLELTSRLLAPNQEHGEINDMLEAGAAAAMKMPRLKVMELWNGDRSLACVFRYQAAKTDRPARITWRGNWALLLESRVTQSWEAVALLHAQCKFEVVEELLDPDIVINSHGDAINYLEFLHPVVHPVSLWQIQRETTSERIRLLDLQLLSRYR